MKDGSPNNINEQYDDLKKLRGLIQRDSFSSIDKLREIIKTSGLDKEIADCIYGFDALTNIQPPKIISLFKCVDPKMDDLTQDNIINIIKLAVRSFGGSSLEEIVTTIAS